MDPPPPLSKSAQKKAAREARFTEIKLQRRAREKEAKKEKKRVRAELRAAGELDEEDQARKKKKPRVQFGGKVVVDLGFDDLMSEKEVKSLCSQLAYTYSANRAASYPFSLLFTSLGGRVLQRLEDLNQAGYKRWSKTEWWSESYEQLWHSDVGTINHDAPQNSEGPSDTQDTCSKDVVVYLTADSAEELSELKPDEIYIIGGIVDRNRYKNLCQKKAEEANVRTARLPIGKYLENFPTRKVLTVNQVFEILVNWVETRDWEVALNAVMPKRKFNPSGRHAKSEGDSNDDDQLEDDARAGGEGKGELGTGQVGTQNNVVNEATVAVDRNQSSTPPQPAW